MRLKYMIYNTFLSLILFMVTAVLGFIRRKVTFEVLGADIVGLTALFSDVLALLNMADVGLSGAIGAVLYGPIHKREFGRIRGILDYYKKLYRIAGIAFLVFSIIAIFPLNDFIKSKTITNLESTIYFILYVINTAVTYFFSYKLILMVTDQKLYQAKILDAIFKIIFILSDITALLLFKSFYVLLLFTILLNIVYLILMNIIINKSYKELKIKKAILIYDDKRDILKSIKGLIFHRIAAFIVTGTNYLYTTLFSGLNTTATYSNYQLVITMINRLITGLFSSITSTLGNIIATEESDKRYEYFKIILLINFWIASISSIVLINTLNTFISIWVGQRYVVSNFILFLLIANYFFTSIRPATEQFKFAAGIFYEDRFIPILESLINGLACLLLGYKFGLSGILMGNLISTLCIVSWQKPYMTFKYVFNRSVLQYFSKFLIYIFIGILSLFISKKLIEGIFLPQSLFGILLTSVICLIVYNLIFVLCLWKTREFKQLLVLSQSFLNKKIKQSSKVNKTAS